MPNVGPGQQIIPGHAAGTFPQFGADKTTGKIVQANNNAQKLTDIASGYLVWFSSKQAATNFLQNQKGFFGSGGQGEIPNLPNPLAGVAAIGDFFNRLTQANTWIRVGEALAGLLLLYLGLNAAMKGTSAGNAIQQGTKTVKNTGKRAVEAAGFIPK